jgi:hypothetical protein
VAELPLIFGQQRDQLVYFHAPDASRKTLDGARSTSCLFEIDLAMAESNYHSTLTKGKPYIGHPEEFYTILKREFPKDNVSLDEFKLFLTENPKIHVLIDIKHVAVLDYLADFIKSVGPKKCMVHAFIKNWTILPSKTTPAPHWYQEDMNLFQLDVFLHQLGVSFIANCRGFSDDHILENKIIDQMIKDCRSCHNVIAIGFYYPAVALPNLEFLSKINEAGYYAWVGANSEEYLTEIGSIKHIGMCDDLRMCTNL